MKRWLYKLAFWMLSASWVVWFCGCGGASSGDGGCDDSKDSSDSCSCDDSKDSSDSCSCDDPICGYYGPQCYSSSECGDGVCINGNCVSRYCLEDSHCLDWGITYYCDKDLEKCVQYECVSDWQCPEGSDCVDGYCVSPEVDGDGSEEEMEDEVAADGDGMEEEMEDDVAADGDGPEEEMEDDVAADGDDEENDRSESQEER